MPSDYIKDLIDHKERIAKYMCVAADMLYNRTMSIDPLEEYTLISIIASAAHYQQDGIAPLEGLQPKGQLTSVIANTMAFFSTEGANERGWLYYAASDLFQRAAVHDNSKFSPEEFDLYEKAFPELQKYAYGTPEYKAATKLLGPAWKHHCEANDHHPEHFEHGIVDMHGNQQLEMCADWVAASERSQTDIMVGLEKNKERFGIDDHLFPVIKNTVIFMKGA